MAFDLHQQVPSFSPASVWAFLSETVAALPDMDRQKTYALHEIVAEAQTHRSLSEFRNVATSFADPPAGRGPVVALIAYPGADGSRVESDFRRFTGVSPKVQVTLSNWATWVFRELMAGRAAREVVDHQEPGEATGA
jgi:hypothetical protein